MSKAERLIDTDDAKKTTDTEALRELYYSKKAGLTSLDKLWKKVKKQGLNYSKCRSGWASSVPASSQRSSAVEQSDGRH